LRLSHRANLTRMIDLADIAPAFTFVVGKGLVPAASDYRPHDFGIAALVMAGTPFSLRFEHDRGQVFVEAGNHAAGWYPLERVIEFVGEGLSSHRLGEPATLARLLQRHWNKVVAVFADPQQTLQLQAFAKLPRQPDR